MFNLSLFKSTTTFACKEFKKKFWFWQILNLKTIGMIFVLSAAYTVAAVLGAWLVSLIVLPRPESVHFANVWDVWHWVVQYCVSVSTGLRLALAGLLIMSIIAGFFVYLYTLISYSFVSLANTLDVAHDKKPRDFKAIKQVMSFFFLSFLMSLLSGSEMFLVALPYLKISLFSLLLLFFNLRFYFAFFVVLDKGTNVWQALCKSWKITKGQMKVLFPVVLFVLMPNILGWAISQKLIVIPWFFAFILWLIWWIVNSFFLLIMARAYTILNRA